MDAIAPYVNWLIILMQVARIPLTYLSFRKPELTKYMYDFQMLFWAIKHLSPRDYGDLLGFYTAVSLMSNFLMFSFHLWRCFILATVTQAYTLILINIFVYQTPLKKSII